MKRIAAAAALTAMAAWALAGLLSCGSDFRPDKSFYWGTAGGGLLDTSMDAVGWIGGGTDGFQTSAGAASGQAQNAMNRPSDVCLAADGYLYVADTDNHRICRWSPSGVSAGWIGHGVPGWQTGPCTATGGMDDHSFDDPRSVWVDGATGDIFVADADNDRVLRWDAAGNSIGWIGGGSTGWQLGTAPGPGNGPSYFHQPSGVYVHPNGDIYVADTQNHRVCKWSDAGSFLGWIGGGLDTWQTGPGASLDVNIRAFQYPRGVCVAADGTVYVADGGNHRIAKWTGDGYAVGWIGGEADGWQTDLAPWFGQHPQLFDSPTDVFLCDGVLYVADYWNHRISRWTVEGRAAGWIGDGQDGWRTAFGATQSSDLRGFGQPTGVQALADGSLLVADANNHRVCLWTPSGQPPGSGSDTTPPDPIVDLQASPGTVFGEADLSWTAVGDDGTTGTASAYVLRYSLSVISEADFDTASLYVQAWTPLASGQTENRTLTGLASGTTLYFAIKAVDDQGQASSLSNVVSVAVP